MVYKKHTKLRIFWLLSNILAWNFQKGVGEIPENTITCWTRSYLSNTTLQNPLRYRKSFLHPYLKSFRLDK